MSLWDPSRSEEEEDDDDNWTEKEEDLEQGLEEDPKEELEDLENAGTISTFEFHALNLTFRPRDTSLLNRDFFFLQNNTNFWTILLVNTFSKLFKKLTSRIQ